MLSFPALTLHWGLFSPYAPVSDISSFAQTIPVHIFHHSQAYTGRILFAGRAFLVLQTYPGMLNVVTSESDRCLPNSQHPPLTRSLGQGGGRVDCQKAACKSVLAWGQAQAPTAAGDSSIKDCSDCPSSPQPFITLSLPQSQFAFLLKCTLAYSKCPAMHHPTTSAAAATISSISPLSYTSHTSS